MKPTVPARTASGMPAFIGVLPMNQSSVEKNGWSATATVSRPVAARASLSAAVVASEPFLANFTMSAPETRPRKSSAASTSSRLGREKDSPRSSTSRTAAFTGS